MTNNYLNNEINLFTLEDERDLILKAQSGDSEAKELLIQNNSRLVYDIAFKLYTKSNQVNCFEDMYDDGLIGLIKAIDNFDVKFNTKLSTYAVPLIKGEILNHKVDVVSSLDINLSDDSDATLLDMISDNSSTNFVDKIYSDVLKHILQVFIGCFDVSNRAFNRFSICCRNIHHLAFWSIFLSAYSP